MLLIAVLRLALGGPFSLIDVGSVFTAYLVLFLTLIPNESADTAL